ncbi:MAG: flagellar basal body-associated FliL family protein [Sulfurimonas sp.]|uniref:flagellar basal body-associated FliL family protein n=1 Tax=Sulfurimonas sp. TaxID=2022749 RepID=UPI0025FB532F|nr:flagellar basal body-associated FliL family protein [Sulfurimonas sp.]MCK9492334.1 flagellar basal body-associated FliL family protein [Sulfurimonas sp.]
MLQKIITIIIWLVIASLLILLIIYGVSTSDFKNLKKYENEDYGISNVRDKMQNPSKKKQEFAKERFYTNRVTIKSSTMANLGDFTVNIAGDKKLILNISLKYKNKDGNSWLSTNGVKNEILVKGDVLRDAVIHTFSNSNSARATNNKMKKELVQNINAYLSEGEIEEVYFNRFLIQ